MKKIDRRATSYRGIIDTASSMYSASMAWNGSSSIYPTSMTREDCTEPELYSLLVYQRIDPQLYRLLVLHRTELQLYSVGMAWSGVIDSIQMVIKVNLLYSSQDKSLYRCEAELQILVWYVRDQQKDYFVKLMWPKYQVERIYRV